MKKMQQETRKVWEKIYVAHEKAGLDLRAQGKILEDREKELQRFEKDLQRCQVQNENERKKLYLEKKNVIIFGCLKIMDIAIFLFEVQIMLHLFK